MIVQLNRASNAQHRFDAINGLLVPGGSGNLTAGHPFYDNTEYLLQLAIEANDNGDYFPVRLSTKTDQPVFTSHAGPCNLHFVLPQCLHLQAHTPVPKKSTVECFA